MSTQETITLSRDSDSWIATTNNPESIRLFGAASLPTAFAASVAPEVVLAEIRKLNPGAIVTLAA